MSQLETTPEPPEGGIEVGVRAYFVSKAKQVIVCRVYTLPHNRVVVIAKPEDTNQTLGRAETIKRAVMGTAWIFSLLRDYKLRTSRYNGISGEAVFTK